MIWTRRDFLKAGLASAAAAALPACHFRASAVPRFPVNLPSTTPWPEANAILAGILVPHFPDATFSVSDFGARGDGQHDDSAAFADTIAACHRAGGGHVIVPAGRFVVGAVRLLSRVDLHLEAGSTLAFGGDARQFPIVLTRYEGIECMNRSPMIYAYGETDIALTGTGTLDASGTAAWNRGRDRQILEKMLAAGVPPKDRLVAGRLRSSFVEPYACSRVLISGVTLVGSRFWQIHPTLCNHVTVDGVTTTAAPFGTTDGCDPESCDGVVIKNSTLASGDDNIAIKSGRDADGRRLHAPSQNIVIMNCQAEGPNAFVACGSEQSGGISNVYIYNNWTYGRGVGAALRVKTNTRRGAFSRSIHVDRFRGSGFRDAVVEVNLFYGDQHGDFLPRVSDLTLSHLDVADAPHAVDLRGLPDAPIENVRISDSRFSRIGSPAVRSNHAQPIAWRDVTVNGTHVK